MKFGLIAGLGRNAQERINAIFLFPRIVNFGSKSGTSLLAESAKTCQHYFWFFCSADYLARPRSNPPSPGFGLAGRSSARESRE
jgi:hypothetical protein